MDDRDDPESVLIVQQGVVRKQATITGHQYLAGIEPEVHEEPVEPASGVSLLAPAPVREYEMDHPQSVAVPTR